MTGVKQVVSPMSAEQMVMAADEHIVALFKELTDEKRRHPKREVDEFVGGSLEASRAFGEFAKKAPNERFGSWINLKRENRNVRLAMRCPPWPTVRCALIN